VLIIIFSDKKMPNVKEWNYAEFSKSVTASLESLYNFGMYHPCHTEVIVFAILRIPVTRESKPPVSNTITWGELERIGIVMLEVINIIFKLNT
jgi:hypothetical protein